MLHAGRDSVGLHALDVGNHHRGGEVGVFAHVLEVASVEGSAVDVDSGTEEHGLVAVAGLFSYALAVEQRHVLVPGGCEAGQRGEGNAGVIGPAGLVPFVPEDFGAYPVGAVGGPDFGNAETRHSAGAELGLGVDHGDLLFQRHSAERILDAVLDGLGLIEVDRYLRGQRCCRECKSGDDVYQFHVFMVNGLSALT